MKYFEMKFVEKFCLQNIYKGKSIQNIKFMVQTWAINFSEFENENFYLNSYNIVLFY